MASRILLYRMPQGWAVEFLGACAHECHRLFGCNTLNSPFGPNVAGAVVLAAIRKANPGVTVRIARS